jgi:protein ImuB
MKQERSQKREMCVWFPQWELQRLLAARPELRRRKVVLYSRQRGSSYVVASTSIHGIRAGMPLVEAAAIAAIHAEEHDPLADHAALLQLAGRCEVFSPAVGIEPSDCLRLDVTGVGTLFGGEDLLAEQIVKMLGRRGLSARVAIAGTFGAAWGVAHFGLNDEPFAVIPTEETRATLANLPLAALRLDPREISVLHELGIELIGQLLALPRDSLASRFPPQLLLRLDQATGLIDEVIVSHRPQPDIAAEIQLESPLCDRATIDVILGRLLEAVCRQLAARRHGALQLECCLSCEAGEPVRIRIGLFRASACAEHLFGLAQMQMEHICLPGPVLTVQVSVLNVAPLECWQRELFDGQSSSRERERKVGMLIDRLSSRLGREAVYRVMPEADAQPELAVRYEPLAGSPPCKGRRPAWKKSPHRPLLLEDVPLAIDTSPIRSENPPAGFEWHGWYCVAAAWGPERIQTGWWRGRYVQRDYYRVETTAGKRFWLFRRIHDSQWFLHGVFD